jgi:hypothetical protein
MAKGVFLICYGPWKIIVICLSVSDLFHKVKNINWVFLWNLQCRPPRNRIKY